MNKTEREKIGWCVYCHAEGRFHRGYMQIVCKSCAIPPKGKCAL